MSGVRGSYVVVVMGTRRVPYVPAWIFLISRYTKPFTEAGIGTKKSGGPNFWPAVTAQ